MVQVHVHVTSCGACRVYIHVACSISCHVYALTDCVDGCVSAVTFSTGTGGTLAGETAVHVLYIHLFLAVKIRVYTCMYVNVLNCGFIN